MNEYNLIKEKVNAMKEIAPKFEIFFVVNVVGKTNILDYKNVAQSILTEYLTEEEYDVMITALKKSGFNVSVFNNEIYFMNYIIDNAESLDFNHIIVFNLARNGKGLNKKALIPSFCQLYGLKLTGSDAYHVCLGRHKYHVNCILSSKNISVPHTWCFSKNGWLLNEAPPQDVRLIIKPAFESASRGINNNSINYYTYKFEQQIQHLQDEFEQDILAQEFIAGYEVQVPVIKLNGKYFAPMAIGIDMDNNSLLCDKIITYDIAYDETYNFYNFAKINTPLAQQLMKTAESACAILGLEQYGRFDFRIDANGSFYITDISTHPFLIKHSAFAYMFSILDLNYEDIFLLLISLALNLEGESH